MQEEFIGSIYHIIINSYYYESAFGLGLTLVRVERSGWFQFKHAVLDKARPVQSNTTERLLEPMGTIHESLRSQTHGMRGIAEEQAVSFTEAEGWFIPWYIVSAILISPEGQ